MAHVPCPMSHRMVGWTAGCRAHLHCNLAQLCQQMNRRYRLSRSHQSSGQWTLYSVIHGCAGESACTRDQKKSCRRTPRVPDQRPTFYSSEQKPQVRLWFRVTASEAQDKPGMGTRSLRSTSASPGSRPRLRATTSHPSLPRTVARRGIVAATNPPRRAL
uniref:Uncharacterized protein n=1 Tax=Oryza punctata TaxID=4537 RepID=A0A0E0L2C6_ORYPU